MLPVGRFAKLAQVSARTVRYYESIGLLPPPSRGENNYRYYDQRLLERVARIRDLQGLGFSLGEIKEIVEFSNADLTEHLERRLSEVALDVAKLETCRQRLQNLLSVTKKIESGESITDTERTFFMNAIRKEIVSHLETKYSSLSTAELNYLQRDSWLYGDPRTAPLVEAIKKCVAFSKERKLTLGPGRGSSPASISLYGLGFSQIDPMKYEMVPERLLTQDPIIHIDVEFARGQEFVDLCQRLNRDLTYGELQAFKMPLIDIVNGVHETLGYAIDYDEIDENSDTVLEVFRKADLEKIFVFDYSSNALVMKYENFLPGYQDLETMTSYLRGQPIRDFRDIINITSIWRPSSQELVDRIELYRSAKLKPFKYDFLAPELLRMLEPNFGRIIYHEDLMQIIAHYTGWDLNRCNALRKSYFQRDEKASSDWLEFERLAPRSVSELVREESRWTFCMPHSIAFGQITKQTAILKTLHRDLYFAEIKKIEKRHGFVWDDIGIRLNGVSLLQS